MGYRGRVEERQRARELRARSWTLNEIANELGVSKSSVSTWVRDVEFAPRPRNRGHPAGPKHPMRVKKEAEIERCRLEAEQWQTTLTERDLEMFVLGLYAGEGSKTDGEVAMANTDPAYLSMFFAGSGRGSTSTSSGCARSSTCTRVSTSSKPHDTGARCSTSQPTSSPSPTGRSPTARFGPGSMSMAAPLPGTRAL